MVGAQTREGKVINMAWETAALVAAFFVIALWSILFKDTIVYRFAERTFVGVTLGVTITMAILAIRNGALTPITNGNYIPIIAVIFGLAMLTRLSKKYGWISRYPVALMTGTGLALMTRTSIQAQILSQVAPLVTTPFIGATWDVSFGNIFAWVGFIGGMSYFLFATPGLPVTIQKNIGYLNRFGRYVIMMMLGTYFANILLGRSSMMLERVYFILQTLGLVH